MNYKLININFIYRLKYLIPIPFLLNLFINFYESDFKLLHLNFTILIIGFVSFIFLYSLGSIISKILNVKYKSLCIAIFYISFFVLNFTSLLLSNYFYSFNFYFYLTIFIWTVLFIYKYKTLNIKDILICTTTFLIINILKNNTLSIKNVQTELSSDTTYFWTPMSKFIFEDGLYFALENNIIPGYGLLINYIHAVNFKLFINEINYFYHPLTTTMYLFLGILFILELDFKSSTKYGVCILYISILLNSDWLSYLFFNSSMGEGVVNFLFSVFIVFFINFINKDVNTALHYSDYVIIFFAGFLYFTKPFASYLILLIFILLFLQRKNFKLLIIGFTGYFVNFLNYKFIISGNVNDGYINSSELTGLGALSNFKLTNILLIFRDFFLLDKVITLFFIFLFILVIINFRKNKKISPNLVLLLLNLILVLFLYISIWQTKELGSAYRYIISFYNLYFLLYIEELSQ